MILSSTSSNWYAYIRSRAYYGLAAKYPITSLVARSENCTTHLIVLNQFEQLVRAMLAFDDVANRREERVLLLDALVLQKLVDLLRGRRALQLLPIELLSLDLGPFCLLLCLFVRTCVNGSLLDQSLCSTLLGINEFSNPFGYQAFFALISTGFY